MDPTVSKNLACHQAVWYERPDETQPGQGRLPSRSSCVARSLAALGGDERPRHDRTSTSRGGYAITIPTTWQPIPRTVAQMKTLDRDAEEEEDDRGSRSSTRRSLASPAGRSRPHRLPLPGVRLAGERRRTPIPTEVSLGIATLTKTYTDKRSARDRRRLRERRWRRNKGSKITVPKIVNLPSGKAEFIVGTIPAGSGIENGFELYLIPHGKRLYDAGVPDRRARAEQRDALHVDRRQFKIV